MIRHLPEDWRRAALLGRLDLPEGPTPVLVRDGRVRDISRAASTTAEALALPDPAGLDGRDLGPLETLGLRPVWEEDDPAAARLLSPIDLQCIKATGVTFAVSALERVIEERAGGDAAAADAIRQGLSARIGGDLAGVRPGSVEAKSLKAALIADGLWSQYLEVAIGPDAEIFTKAAVLSSVGWGAQVGVLAASAWNNPEPEVVLVCDPEGRPRGAALGNDVNLRDIEGRSALLLGKAKDNNASCALGPFIRLFDAHFDLDDVRRAEIGLEVVGEDGFRMEGSSSMSRISRDPLELVANAHGRHHQYPDGFVMFMGTMFAPSADRGAPGHGFTHKAGDMVRISSPRLGVLENQVVASEDAPPWTFGVAALMRNLAARGLLTGPAA